MDDPSNSNLSVWLRCKLCEGSFSKLSEFIQHKQQWHLTEFQRTNTHCVVFEEFIPIENQQFNDEFLSGRTPVNNAAKNFQLHQELEGDFSGSVPVPAPAADVISNGSSRIVQAQLALVPIHKNVEHTEIATDAKLFKTGFPKVQVKRLTSQQIEVAINKLKNSRNTDDQKSTGSTTLKQEPGSSGANNSSVYTDLRPFKCMQPGCTKEFKRKDHYKKHSQVHKEIRPRLTCPFCNIKVFWKASLSRHYSLVHSPAAKLHECSHAECSKTFKTRDGLKRHNNKTHTNHGDCVDRPVPVFTCQICKTMFRRKDHLKRHNLAQFHNRKLLGKF